MITRNYFFSYRAYYNDNSGGFYTNHCTISRKSWLPKSHDVFAEQYSKSLEQAKERATKPVGSLVVTAFNRI